MDTAFDPRLRFIILWVLAETWFALAVSATTPYLAQSGNLVLLQALSFLTAPVAAAGQMLLLRGRVAPAWLWLAAGVGAAVLLFVLFRILIGGVFAGVLPRPGGGLPAWMPYLVLSGVVAGLALALPQALAAGRPVVAYDSDGAGEVCLDGQTGYLVRPDDHATLIACLARLAEDPALATGLGLAGREFVRERFTVERLVDDQCRLYRRLAAKHGLALHTPDRPTSPPSP